MEELKIIAGSQINSESKESDLLIKSGNARANIGIPQFIIIKLKKQ